MPKSPLSCCYGTGTSCSPFNRKAPTCDTKAWRQVLKRVGISDFRWHDLRHTWASWHVQAGTPLHVLQELGSWECVEMVRKYAHLASDHLVQYVDRMSGLRLVPEGEVATMGLRAAK